MKNILLTGLAVASLALSANAQTRMTISEEFTGENCGPCASTNPRFWALCDSTPNTTKLIHISYMVPIPTSGWYYLRTQATSDARSSYYSINSAPHHMYDGHVASPSSSSPGHPFYFSQAEIDAEAAVASPFNVTCTSAWNATYDSVVTTVTVTCVTAYSAATPYLRAALVQSNHFATSPGSNGETDFENVVQAMYPNALGTSLSGTTWAAGTSRTYTITGAIPSFVDKSQAPYMVVWIQNDADKSIAQAAQSTPLPPVPNDASIASLATPGFVCSPNTTYSASHNVVFKNVGATTITSATIYYKVDGATTFANYAWTGSVAAGATTTAVLPVTVVTVTGAFYHSYYDSIGNINGSTDYNLLNNTIGANYFIESTVGLPLPYSTSFESADLGKFYYTDRNNNGDRWGAYSNSTLGHTGTIAVKYDAYNFARGEAEIITLPELVNATTTSIDFWVAYKRYDTTSNEQLEVVYSTDCGTNWTSVWGKSGANICGTAVTTAAYTPVAADYKKYSVNVSAAPVGSILGFRGTSDYGNNIWLDDIKVYQGLPAAVEQVNAASENLEIFPNPATTDATIEFNMSAASDVHVTITDQLGRTVANVAQGNLASGKHAYNVNTAAFAAGVYYVTVRTEGNVTTKQLSVIK